MPFLKYILIFFTISLNFSRFLTPSGDGLNVDSAKRGSFLAVRCLSHLHAETRTLTIDNHLGIITALERIGLTVAPVTVNPFGDGLDSILFYHKEIETDSCSNSDFWAMAISPPTSHNLTIPSKFESTAPTTTTSPPTMERRRSSAFKIDFSSSSALAAASNSNSENCNDFDNPVVNDNPFGLRFFKDPPGKTEFAPN